MAISIQEILDNVLKEMQRLPLGITEEEKQNLRQLYDPVFYTHIENIVKLSNKVYTDSTINPDEKYKLLKYYLRIGHIVKKLQDLIIDL